MVNKENKDEINMTPWVVMQKECSKAPMARLHIFQIALEYEDAKALLTRIEYEWGSFLKLINKPGRNATLDQLDQEEQDLMDYAKAYETVEDGIHRFEQARDLEDHTSKDNYVWLMLDGKLDGRTYFGAIVTISNALHYLARLG